MSEKEREIEERERLRIIEEKARKRYPTVSLQLFEDVKSVDDERYDDMLENFRLCIQSIASQGGFVNGYLQALEDNGLLNHETEK